MTPYEQDLLQKYLAHLNVVGVEGEYPDFEAWHQAVGYAQGPGAPRTVEEACELRYKDVVEAAKVSNACKQQQWQNRRITSLWFGGGLMDSYCQSCQADREMENPQAIILSNDEPATRGDCGTCGRTIYRLGGPPPGVPVAEHRPTCYCGIEISRATGMCTEPDCPYRR